MINYLDLGLSLTPCVITGQLSLLDFLRGMLSPLHNGDLALKTSLVLCAVDTFDSALSQETAPMSQQVISKSRVTEKNNSAESCHSSGK